MKLRYYIILTFILMLITSITSILSTIKLYPKPIVNPSIVYKYDTLPPETTMVSVPDTFMFEYELDSSNYIHTDSLNKVITFYKSLVDSANAFKFYTVQDFQIFPTNDSVNTTYYYPSYKHPEGYFKYNFYPARDSLIYVLVPNTMLLKPKITFTVYGKYLFDNSLNTEFGCAIFYNTYGIISGIHLDNNRKILYSAGFIKNFNFY